MTKKFPLVSVIIVNWNGGQVFDDCLKTLSKISYPNWEMIVVDNGSEDGSENLPLKYKRFSKAKIIKNKINLGFAGANNQGVRVAKGEYVLLLNNDTRVTPDFLSKLVTRSEADPQIGIIQPKIFLYDNPGYLDNAGSYLTNIGFLKHWGFMEKDSAKFSQETEIFSAKGACMLIKKSVIQQAGGLFDKDFFSYFEESDFCWRVSLLGYKILFYPDALIYHKLGYTIRRLNVAKLNYHYYKNRICSLIKNLESKNLLLVLIPHLFISGGIILAFLLKLKFQNAWMVFRALLWNLVNLPKTLKKREAVQKNRVVTDSKLFKKLSRPIEWNKYREDFSRVSNDIERKVASSI